MPSDRLDDGQLSLDFEHTFDVQRVESEESPLAHKVCSGDVVPRLYLVVRNSTSQALSPNSVEVTRLLAEQARGLRW
jgi:hypothetical protein